MKIEELIDKGDQTAQLVQAALNALLEYERFVNLVRKGHLLDAGSEKDELHETLETYRDEILHADIDSIPAIFDYRSWFRFQLKVVTENEEGRVIDRRVKSLGSGGEQAVPNYLLILTVAEFLYHGGESVEPSFRVADRREGRASRCAPEPDRLAERGHADRSLRTNNLTRHSSTG